MIALKLTEACMTADENTGDIPCLTDDSVWSIWDDLKYTFGTMIKVSPSRKLNASQPVVDEFKDMTSDDCIKPCNLLKFAEPSELNGFWPITKEFENKASDNCIEFCNTLGLIHDLRNCLNQIDHTFSNIKYRFAELGYFQDDDSEDEGHIVFQLKVTSERNKTREEYKNWLNWFVNNIANEKRHFFILDLVRI